MHGVRVSVLEEKGQRVLAEYMLSGDRAVLTAGKDLGSVAVSEADAELAPGLHVGAYTTNDGSRFLNALLVTFKSGTRMRADAF